MEHRGEAPGKPQGMFITFPPTILPSVEDLGFPSTEGGRCSHSQGASRSQSSVLAHWDARTLQSWGFSTTGPLCSSCTVAQAEHCTARQPQKFYWAKSVPALSLDVPMCLEECLTCSRCWIKNW